MSNILTYFMPIIDITKLGNLIYSCDMLRLKFICYEKEFVSFMNRLCFMNVEYQQYQSLALFKYRYMWTLTFGNSTLRIGYLFNNGKSKINNEYGFIEFNPNKCIIDKEKFFTFYNSLSICFKNVEIVSYDIAIDIPIKRNYCHLKREYKKTYTTISKDYKNEDLTEYYGLIHSNGTTKLYNKTIESDLSYNLTRYEFTYDSININDIKKILPLIYIDKDYSYNIEDYKLSSTEKVLLHYLLNDECMTTNFKRLSRSMQQKLKPYVEDNKIIFEPNFMCIFQVLSNIKDLFCKTIYKF